MSKHLNVQKLLICIFNFTNHDDFIYQAIDKHGDTFEFMFSAKRYEKTARKFFKKKLVDYYLLNNGRK